MIKFQEEEIKFLAGKLHELLSVKLESQIEITQRNHCYLLNQSDSVISENYCRMLDCVKLLLEINEQSKSDNFISLYSFNTNVYQEAPLTNDPSVIVKKIKGNNF